MPGEKRSFFDGLYSQLSRVQATQNREDFDILVRGVKPRVTAYAAWMKSRYNIPTVDIEDYVQEGLIALWRFLSKFRYICPDCKEEFKRCQDYVAHRKGEHGSVVQTLQKLAPYLDFRIKRYMRNLKRSQLNTKKRSAAVTVHMDETFDMPDENPNAEALVCSVEALQQLRRLVDAETNAKIKIFVAGCLRGREVRDIYKCMVREGLAGTEQSARITVANLRGREELKAYRHALLD